MDKSEAKTNETYRLHDRDDMVLCFIGDGFSDETLCIFETSPLIKLAMEGILSPKMM